MFTSLNLDIKEIKNDITVFGRTRFGDAGELRLSWSASGFGVRFSGAAIAVFTVPYESDSYVSVKFEIDGVPHKACIKTGADIIFADGLEDGEHTFRLFRASEGDVPLQVKSLQVVGANPQILPYKPEYKFKMEVIGDSITCGYAAYRGIRTGSSCFEEDATIAYAHLAAEKLCAELRLIAYSGRGLVRSCAGEAANRFVDMFGRAEYASCSEPYNFGDWQPDILVINGGTNDNGGAVSEEDFALGVRELYNAVRAVYPNTNILFFYGAMGNRYDGVYRAFVDELSKSDKKLFYTMVEAVDDDKSEMSAAHHPSYIGQKRLARDFERALANILEIN